MKEETQLAAIIRKNEADILSEWIKTQMAK